MKTNHILIIRFSALGDVAMTVPVVYSLAKQYPDIRVTVLSRPFARPLFEGLAPNVGFMAADIKKEYRGVKGLNALYSRLQAKHFTHIADFHNVLRSNYLRLRFNIAQYKVAHIDKHRAGKRALTSLEGKVFKQQPTSFENYAEVLKKLGYPVKIEFNSIFENKNISLRDIGIENYAEKKPFQKWIGIAPFAAHDGKIYPTEKMEKVIEMITTAHPSCRIFLFGGGIKEKMQFDKWCKIFQQCNNASEELGGLSNELILMNNLDVMISMDSANMHFASLVGTPVVSIWGATHPYSGFMGWNQNPKNAVQVELDCRPCSIYGNKPCYRKDFACLNMIEPEMIFERVETILK